MSTIICDKLIPVAPRPCGGGNDKHLVRIWRARGRSPGEAVAGRGVAIVTKPSADFSWRPFTFECWLTWPKDKKPLAKPAIVVEAEGKGWGWSLGFDHAGTLMFTWRSGKTVKIVPGEMLVDAFQSGDWYHIALVSTGDRIGMAATEAGRPIARWSGGMLYFSPPGDAPVAGKARLAIGRSLERSDKPDFLIASAAWHDVPFEAADFASLGGSKLPVGVNVDTKLEYGSLGRVLGVGREAISFSTRIDDSPWFAFRVRGAKGRKLRFLYFPGSAMGVCVVVSDDGGKTWRRPNGGVWRDSGRTPELCFEHKSASGETIFANSIPVTATMAERWVMETAKRFGGRIHDVGRSRLGKRLRVLEAGNPEAPLVYLQAGQHSMMERLGYFLITAMFEAAALDAELLSKTRWLIMPLVNVDCYTSPAIDGNMNRFWGRAGGAPTIRALERFLLGETGRTGGIALFDFHAGTVWRGHTLIGETDQGHSEPSQGGDKFHQRRRESLYPELERCLLAEGVDYCVINDFARKPQTLGMFDRFARFLPGVRVGLTVELSSIAASTPDGTGPVTAEDLRSDGVRWHRALRKYIL